MTWYKKLLNAPSFLFGALVETRPYQKPEGSVADDMNKVLNDMNKVIEKEEIKD